jgi:Ca2+-binding RTX toxin-like protein
LLLLTKFDGKSLETRSVEAAATQLQAAELIVDEVGVNLNAVSYWSTEEPFIDRMHTAGSWAAKNSSGGTVALTLNDRGDPANLTGVSSLSVAVAVDPKSAAPSDEYVLTYSGTAHVSIANAKIVSQTAGKVVFDYTGGDTKPNVNLSFTGLDPAHPVSDVHLVRADQQNLFQAGEIFNPDFIAKVSQWGVVRFMDWGNTNTSGDVSWATRTTLDDQSWSYFSHNDGVPLEAMVKLANEAHVDMWYNVPTKADDTFVRNALTYIRDHLDPGLKVHVEWSNEVWNSGFAANKYAQSQADALWGNGTSVGHGDNVYYGYRSAQVASIAHQVFTGTHSDQLVDVLAGQAANAGLMTPMLQGIAKAGVGSVSALFDDYAIAPYFGAEMGQAVHSVDLQTIVGWAKSGAAGLDAAFKELEFGGTLSGNMSLAVVYQWIAKSGAVAQANGLSLVAYEGGVSLGTTRFAAADKPAVQDFFNRLLADPRMGQLYTKLVHAFSDAGGSDFVAFNDVATPSDAGSYGMLASIYDSGSVRNDTLLALSGKVIAGSTGQGTSAGSTASALASTTSGHIVGTSGADKLYGSSSNDTIDGGNGNDSIVGSSGSADAQGHLIESDLYMGGAGSDTIIGGIGNDHIYGNSISVAAGSIDGADSLSGGAGNDYIQGNAGNDTIDGGSGNDRLYGGADNDSILGGSGNDYLQGNRGNDTLSGGDGNDFVHGGADNDRLSGDAGDDQLFGDAGNDTLIGGAGIDTLTGGTGNDTFVFSGHDAAFATSGTLAWATDKITDFTHGTDMLKFDFHPAALLQGSAATVSAAYTSAAQLLQAHAGQADVAAVTVGNDTFLFWDSTGHGGAIDSAVFVEHVKATVLTTADFV